VTVTLADSPTAQPRRARSESDIETSFAEADSPTTQARRAYPESSTENTSAETPADSAIPPATSARPESSTESALAEVLAEVLQVERVSVDSNFFDDLGADSMVMARFCARVRKRPDLPSVSIKDIYQYPTIKSLATAVADAAPAPVETPALSSSDVATPTATSVDLPKRAGTLQIALCGTLQLLIFLAYSYLAALVIAQGYEWISAASGVLDIYLRSVLSTSALFLFLFTVPILAKWILIGRWKPKQIRIWSLGYVRFWVVKTLVRRNPIVMFTGSPLFNVYLRLLGAKVGRGVVILSNHVPICTDLLSIGDGTIIRKDSFINGYRAHAGFIHVGPISIGKNAVISEATVIDIDTAMGDGTQLGHASSLHSGQTVPDGQHWHGSPGRQTLKDNFLTVDPAPCSTFRRVAYAAYQLLSLLLVWLPMGIAVAILLLLKVPRLSQLMAAETAAFTNWTFYRDALVVSLVLYLGSLLVGFVIVTTVPRLLNLLIRPYTVYRLYGFYYGLHRLIARLTNAKALSGLVGDTSWIVHYLRGIGYDLGKIVQTGANFGGMVKHESPYLSSIGTGTMVADALSMMNAEFSSTSFRLSWTFIGERNFLGNGIVYPSKGRTRDNCLLATKVMVPISGKVRENVGLLGSPAFEIPRSVDRDSSFDHLKQGDGLRRRLAAKNRHNFITILWCLFVRWFFVFMLTVLLGLVGDFYASLGAAAIVLNFVFAIVLGIAYEILVDRIVRGFKPLPVLFCSIYELAMWRHERYWKVPSTGYLAAFAGTPFINMILRRVGVRIGRRVFNDGCGMTERTLVTIGDDCTINEASTVQCHSQEDGTFKSDYSTLGSNVTLGTAAHVHYGVTIGDGAVIASDSFLMKGEEVPPYEHWGGNPASEMRVPAAPSVRQDHESRSAALVGMY